MNKLVFCFLLILGCQYVSAQDIALKDLTGLYLANISYVEKQMQAKGFKFEGVDGDENTIYSNSLDTSVVSEGFWYLLGWQVKNFKRQPDRVQTYNLFILQVKSMVVM